MLPKSIEKLLTARAILLRDESKNFFEAVNIITQELDGVNNGEQNELYDLANATLGVTPADLVDFAGPLIAAIIGFITQMLTMEMQEGARLQELRKKVEPIVSKIYEEEQPSN